MSAVGTNADDLDGGLQFLLKEGDVVTEGLGELGLGGELRHVGLPAGEFLIDGLDALFDVIGEVAGEDTVDLIGGTCLDGVEAIEDVGLHHDELGDAIDHDAIAEGYQVDPATAALTTGDGTILMTEVTDELASLVEQLSGERTGTDTGAVGLHDAIDLANLVGTNAQTGAGTCTDGVGRGDKGIGTEIDIEHGALSTLAENGLAGTQCLVDLMFGIDQVEAAEVVYALEPLLLDLRKLYTIYCKIQTIKDSLMASLMSGIFLFEVVEDVTHAESIARDLIGIGRTNALTGGAYLVLTLLRLIGCIEQAMGGHDEVGLLGDMQAVLQLMTASLQCLGFLHEQVGSQDDTIAYDIRFVSLENTGGNGAKHIFLTFELQRMTGIRTSLEASHHIILGGEHINDLTFSFIAPLQAQQDINFSLIHFLYLFGSFSYSPYAPYGSS